MQIQKKLKPYFSFTLSERRGLFVLIILLIILYCVRLLGPLLLKPSEKAVISLKTVTLKIRLADSTNNKSSDKYYINSNPLYENILEGRKIDPNSATYEEFIAMGFPITATKNIIKYRASGGHFRDANDLKKIYGLDSVRLNKLKSNIEINLSNLQPVIKNSELASKSKLNINAADTNDIVKLNGVGKTLGKRIIRYRELLGGFNKMEQLSEVYGISPASYEKLTSQIIIDTFCLKKLNLNEATLEKLERHPYISDYQAKAIIEYRNYKHKINSVNELLLNKIFTREEFVKVIPYLIVTH